MKKYIAIICCLFLLSCDDGDFDVPAFEFNETINSCDVNNNSYTLFRLSDTEALIITLSTSQITNNVTTEPIEVSITSDNVVYRTFNDAVSASYFCEDIPPVEPTILSNWTGVEGSNNKILIETIEEYDDMNVQIGYRHTITFQNLTLENGDETLTYTETDFGSFITSI